MRKIAIENNCGRTDIRKIIYGKLALKKHHRTKVQDLALVQKARRKTSSGWFRENFNSKTWQKIMFSNQKIFDGDGQLNRKNDVIYAKSRKQANSDA